MANKVLEKSEETDPKTEMARRDMYLWRVERVPKKKNIKITAYLEKTSYTINVKLKEKSGDIIDPATKADSELFFGESDY